MTDAAIVRGRSAVSSSSSSSWGTSGVDGEGDGEAMVGYLKGARNG